MALRPWYRWFSYLTLALSCACLIQAEMVLLPGMQLCLPPLLLLFVLAHAAEGRWSLSAWGANLLGVLIFVGTAGWVFRALNDPLSWISQLPRPAGLIPMVGPVMLCLLVVKLFRPRTPGDFWFLQGLGLLQVGLGCLITGDMPFALLLAAYVLSGLACLTLHYHGHQPTPPGVSASVRRLLSAAGQCFVVIAPAALLLFLLTPRLAKSTWQPMSRYPGPGSSLFAAQPGMLGEIDLNHTGAVYLDEEVALTVTVTDAGGRPKNDLSPGQRWRALVLERYEGGLWRRELHTPVFRPQKDLPDLGPGQFFVDYKVQPYKAGGLVLAEPLCFGPVGRRLPVILQSSGPRRRPVFGEAAGTILPGLYNYRREYHYRQVLPGSSFSGTAPTPRPDLLHLESLRSQQVSGLTEWTLALLQRLAQRGVQGLHAPALALDNEDNDGLPLEQWEPAARALSEYLAVSGEYTYTLELRRHDIHIDPVMDFLLNLKEGHCERYATALALMLRSVRIPARVVTGYRGAEPQEEGVYVIRHSHAHSWVEALVPHSSGPDLDLSWLTLDPTPGIESSRRASFSLSRWWLHTQSAAEFFWREMVVRYNAEQQADLWQALLGSPPARLLGILTGGAAAAGLVLFLARRLPRWNRRQRSLSEKGSGLEDSSREGRAALAFYGRLLDLLDRHLRLQPTPAQTAQELALEARERLRGLSLSPALADLPSRIVELLYRVRFGGQTLADTEEQGLAQELDQLAAALSCPGA